MTTDKHNPLPPIPAPDSSIRAFSAGELHAYHSNQAIAAYGDARAAHARKAALEEAADTAQRIDPDNLNDNGRNAALRIRQLK